MSPSLSPLLPYHSPRHCCRCYATLLPRRSCLLTDVPAMPLLPPSPITSHLLPVVDTLEPLLKSHLPSDFVFPLLHPLVQPISTPAHSRTYHSLTLSVCHALYSVRHGRLGLRSRRSRYVWVHNKPIRSLLTHASFKASRCVPRLQLPSLSRSRTSSSSTISLPSRSPLCTQPAKSQCSAVHQVSLLVLPPPRSSPRSSP